MALSAITLLLIVSLGIMFHFSRKVLKYKAFDNADQTLEATAQNIDNILLSVEQSVGNIYWELLMNVNQPDRLPMYCRRIIASNPYIKSCAVGLKPGFYPERKNFLLYAHRKGDEIVTSLGSDNNNDYVKQFWFETTVSSGRSFWTDQFNDDEGEAVTGFCLPIYDMNRQCVGVVMASVPVELFSKIVKTAKPSKNGFAVLLGRNGTFIVNTDTTQLIYQSVFTLTEENSTARKAAEAMIAGETGYKQYTLNDGNYYVFYRPFQRANVPGRTTEKLGWSVGVIYPKDDIFGDYYTMFYLVVAIVIVGLAVFFFLCRFLTHRQLVSLRQLTASAQRIAEGHFDETIPLSTRKDEIGKLQRYFLEMQQSLSANMSKLKELTATLQEHGNELREAYETANKLDNMQTEFLHNMSNQMISPANSIADSVDKLSELSSQFGEKASISVYLKADREVDNIKHQSDTITGVLSDLIQMSDFEKQKGGKK